MATTKVSGATNAENRKQTGKKIEARNEMLDT